MPAKRRLTMRPLRQMLRLAGSGTSSREIAVVLGIEQTPRFPKAALIVSSLESRIFRYCTALVR
jgi:hypothetical protein